MDLTVRTKSWVGRSYEWLASEMGTQHMRTVTLDLDSYDFVTTHPTKVIPAGTLLGKITTSNKYGPYANDGTNEKQTITITGTPTGGTFALTYNGQTTAAIAFNATAAAVGTALAALSNLDAADIAMTGGPFPGTAVVVEFIGTNQGGVDQPQMTANSAGLTGGTTPTAAVTTTTAGIAGATDGRQVATGFLFETVDVSDRDGTNITGDFIAAMLVTGFIKESKLPASSGIDASAKTDLINWFKFF